MTHPLPPGWTCSVCLLEGAASTAAEAELLADIHDSFLHRGAPTARLRGGESARRRRLRLAASRHPQPRELPRRTA